MPYLMDTGARVADLTDATIHLVTTEGLAAVTIRRLADVMRLSPSTLTSHLTSKRRMVHLITGNLGDRVVDLIDRRTRYRGLAGLVPDEADLPVVRSWLAMVELTRTDLGTSEVVTGHQRDVAATVRWAVRPPLEPLVADAVTAVARGLWTAMCATDDPMSGDHARAVLARATDALVPQTTESGSSF